MWNLCKEITDRISRTRTLRVTSQLRCMTPKRGLTSSALLVLSKLLRHVHVCAGCFVRLDFAQKRLVYAHCSVANVVRVYGHACSITVAAPNVHCVVCLKVHSFHQQTSWRIHQLAVESILQLELDGCRSKARLTGYMYRLYPQASRHPDNYATLCRHS